MTEAEHIKINATLPPERNKTQKKVKSRNLTSSSKQSQGLSDMAMAIVTSTPKHLQ
jgi:hypothetical protein